MDKYLESKATVDVNNNVKQETADNLRVELKHSKFCFSNDISEKEETLRSPKTSALSKLNERQSCKKTVTFDSSGPKYSNQWRNNFQDLSSDSDIDIRDMNNFGSGSDSESSSSSANDLFEEKNDALSNKHEDVVLKAEEKLSEVLNQLQDVCLGLDLTNKRSRISSSQKESFSAGKNLLRTVSEIKLLADQLSIHGQKTFAKPSSALDRLRKLQNCNEVQEEEIKNSKNKIECLESEVKYFSKENVLLNAEVKEMAYKMAAAGCKKCSTGTSRGTSDLDTKSPKTEVFYRNPHQQFQASDSNSSAIADQSCSINSTQLEKSDRLECTRDSKSSQTGTVYTGMISENFDEIIKIAKNQITSSTLYAQDLQTYDEQIHRIMTSTTEEKQQILKDLEMLINQHKSLLKERDNLEFILKLLMQEKASSTNSIERLLHTIICKLSSKGGKESCTQISLLEGAVEALQEQNAVQREEIYLAKHHLSEAKECNQSLLADLEGAFKQLEALSQKARLNEQEFISIQQEGERKFEQLHAKYNAFSHEKKVLEESVFDKEEEVKHLNKMLQSLEKTNAKQSKKMQDLQKSNSLLTKEIKELKGNMDHLTEIISKLRSGLKDRKSQLNERLRLSAEEASQNKEHCNWLKCQVEQINQQLSDAHERIKAHEMDKSQLAQQVLLAEEERRVVDRKLQELRTALQGDTGMREALIERNEALQIEINRLRQSKLDSLIGGTEKVDDYFPPMEMKAVNDLISSIKIIQPNDKNNMQDKLLGTKKHLYTSAVRRVHDTTPKTAVSLHNSGLSS